MHKIEMPGDTPPRFWHTATRNSLNRCGNKSKRTRRDSTSIISKNRAARCFKSVKIGHIGEQGNFVRLNFKAVFGMKLINLVPFEKRTGYIKRHGEVLENDGFNTKFKGTRGKGKMKMMRRFS